MNKKKILIITNEFIPYTRSLGGVLRMLYLTKLLVQNGLSVHVLTHRLKDFYIDDYNYLLNDINIHYINNQNTNNKKKIFNFQTIKKNLIRIVKYLFYDLYNSLICFGFDQARFSLNSYEKKANEIIKNHNINNVIISAPPFSLFFISKSLKKNFNQLKIIYDYRDSWVLRFKQNHILKKIALKYLESKIIKNADYITCASKTISEKIIKNFNFINKKKVITIYNGYIDTVKINEIKKNNLNKNVKVGYFGMISDNSRGYRDIKEIYYRFLKSKQNDHSVNFFFYGPNDIKNNNILNYDLFYFFDQINHTQAITEMLNMDYLMLIHTEESTAEEVLTGKLFDYIFCKKPIIVISKGDTEAGRIVDKYKMGLNINLNNKNIDELFITAKNNKKFLKLDTKTYNSFSRNFQNQKFIDILNE